MALRLTLLAAICSMTFAVGCDETYTPPPGATSSTPGTISTTAPSASATMDEGSRERLPLGVIPFSLEVPKGWLMQSGAAGKIILHGKTPTGEVDVLLGVGPSVKAAELPLLVKESRKTSLDTHVKNGVVERDKMTIITTIAPQLAPGAAPSPDPELVPMGWTAQVIVSDATPDLQSYELTFVGLSQAMFDKDEAFLRRIMDSLRYEPAAPRPAAP